MATIRHNTAHAYLPFPVHDRSVPWHSHRLRAAAPGDDQSDPGAGAGRGARHAAGPGHHAAGGRTPRQVRHPRAGRRPRRVRRAHDAGAHRATQPGCAVLHLARRHDRHHADGSPARGGRPRRAGAPAAGRQRHLRTGHGAGGHGRAPEHRGAAVQPLRGTLAQGHRLPDRLPPPEPAHAQQVLHRRQPGHHRRRPQHRRRVFRRGRRRAVLRPGRAGRGPRSAGRLKRLRPLLGQPVGLSRGRPAQARRP